MIYKEILFETTENIAIITLNRPERLNAYTYTMGKEIHDALLKVERDPELRVTIITGAGRGFCAGQDLSSGEDAFERSIKEGRIESEGSEGQFPSLKFYFSLKKPVIVAYNGPAIGVGVTMTLPFDIRIAANSARIGIVFTRRGMIPEIGCPWLLPRIVGLSRAAELMYLGRILSSQEALEYGLVSRVVPDEDLMKIAMEMAKEIAIHCAPVSIALTKHMLYSFLGEPDFEKAERINHKYLAWLSSKPDAREGVTAFFEKREPRWNMKVPGDMPDFTLR
jgi:enoyl-CoA hydratase/carnithine racemase